MSRPPCLDPETLDAAGRRSWFAAWRPALAFAALAIVTGGLVFWPRPSPGPGTTTLRSGPAPIEPRLSIGGATLERGRVAIHWSGPPGVSRYEVRFYSGDLVERGTIATADTALTRPLEQLGFPIDTSRTVLVRVYAIADDGLQSHSLARELLRR